MNQGTKYSLGLIAKLLIILLLPLLLFKYVDSQPTPVAKDEDDEGTRQVAVVNEDLGHENGSEEVLLGQEVTSLLNEQEDYSWVAVNRSSAEQGFSNEDYDAILYVPSNFSENIMTFKDDSPSKASMNYVIQPNLEAKERQRIHREMANAKSAINHEMSTIYWGYVSDEVDNIREQFDKILEKEISFQNAMYSFYTPSSETLANEIANHKNRLENISEQTKHVDELSNNNVNNASEAEEKTAQFVEVLEAYKEHQNQQQENFTSYEDINREILQTELKNMQELNENIKEAEKKYEEQSAIYLNEKDTLIDRFTTMQGRINIGRSGYVKWGKYWAQDPVNQLIDDINKVYNEEIRHVWENEYRAAYDTFENGLNAFKKSSPSKDISDPLSRPEDLDFDEIVTVLIKPMEGQLNSLDEAITVLEEDLKNNEGEGTNPNLENVKEKFNGLNLEKENIKEQIERNSAQSSQIFDKVNEWRNQFDELEEVYTKLNEDIGNTASSVIDSIKNDQKALLSSQGLSMEEREKIKKEFDSLKGQHEKKSLDSLINFSNELTAYNTFLSQKDLVSEDLVNNLREKVDSEISEISRTNKDLEKDLNKMFGMPKSTFSSNEYNQSSFENLLSDVTSNVEKISSGISEKLIDSQTLINSMETRAHSISNQISEVSDNSYDVDKFDGISVLDGQMIFQFQKGTTSSLSNLSDLVSSLGENQNEITSDTEELQAQVGSVQEESDELNNRWSSNVATTEQVKGDVYDVLGNTVVDGQANPYVYDYLSNPVNVEGQVKGQTLSETDDRMPPIVLFVIILLSGLLIGFLTQYYSGNSYLIQAGLFVLLNLAVGMIISIYGLNIYQLDDSQAIMWSAFTILLLMACSNIIRAGLFINPFVGWLTSIAMIMFFISPLLNIVVPEFSFNNPISNVYMGLLYETPSAYTLTMVAMAAVILIVSAFIFGLQIMKNRAKVEEQNEEEAS